MRWPLVFGIGISLTILAVTVGWGVRDHGPMMASSGQAIEAASEAPAMIDPPSSRKAAMPERITGAGWDAHPDISATVAAIADRRNRIRNRASASSTKFRDAAIARYSKESVDHAWAFAQRRRLAEAERELSGAGVESPGDMVSDCRRTICKTIATFATPSAADQWQLLFMATLGGAAKRSVVSRSHDAQGVTIIEIYSVSER